jgi:hypothetical protein
VQFLGRAPVGPGQRRQRLQQLELKRLVALAALDDPELDPLALLEVGHPGRQRGLVDEDVAAVVLGEKAEALLGVVPLDATRRHSESLLFVNGVWRGPPCEKQAIHPDRSTPTEISAVPIRQCPGGQRELEVVTERRRRAGPVEQQLADRQAAAHLVVIDKRRDGRRLRRRVVALPGRGPARERFRTSAGAWAEEQKTTD